MSHLSIDRLAALADEQPTDDEHLHLAHCAKCMSDLNAHRSLLAMAGTERESMGLPLTRWDTLSRRLRAEGLITRPPASREPLDLSRRFSPRALLQIAATLLLVAGGALLGRMSAGAPVIPGGVTGGQPRETASLGRTSVDSLPTTFASVDEARRWKRSYEDAYQKTVSFLAENDSAGRAQTPAVMRARLSALDRVQRTMGEALKDAPYDPVINNYYLNSFGEREATLRMLNTVLPRGVRMNSF